MSKQLAHGAFHLRSREQRRGSVMVEAALIMPWLAFLFVGVFDWGFFFTR